MKIFRPLAILFALLLVLLVLIADQGLAGILFGRLYDFPNGDKVAHFSLYGLLALLVSLGFPARRLPAQYGPLISCLVLAVPVTIEEFSQAFFPGRSASLLDLAASLSGIVLLGELGAWLRRLWRMRHPVASTQKLS